MALIRITRLDKLCCCPHGLSRSGSSVCARHSSIHMEISFRQFLHRRAAPCSLPSLAGTVSGALPFHMPVVRPRTGTRSARAAAQLLPCACHKLPLGTVASAHESAQHRELPEAQARVHAQPRRRGLQRRRFLALARRGRHDEAQQRARQPSPAVLLLQPATLDRSL